MSFGNSATFMMSLPALLLGPMFLFGVTVSDPIFLPGGVSVRETPLYGEGQAVCILLECIPVLPNFQQVMYF